MLKHRYRNVIVLSACVNPSGMSFTVLQDIDKRRKQYIEALSFYLETTTAPVVFIENSGHDFSNLFEKFITNGRLEYITINDNTSFDRIKGKGYGEARMLLYAIDKSSFIKQAKYITKITGRLIVQNIHSIIGSKVLLFDNIIRCNVDDNFLSTTVICAPPNAFYTMLNRHLEEISELDRGNNWIENVLARSFVVDQDINVFLFPFFAPPLFDAFSGTSNSLYQIKDTFTNASDNLAIGAAMCKLRGAIFNSSLLRTLYYVMIVLRKIKVV